MTEASIAGYVKKTAVIQTIAHINVRCDGAAGVLGVSATANVRVSETISGEVRLSGRESVELTVATDDGMKRASGWTEISDRAEIDGVTPQTRAFAVCRVTDTDIVSVGGGSISLASVIEVTVFTEESAVIPLSPPPMDGVYSDGETLRLSKLTARVSGRAESESEKLPLAEVLCYTAGVDAGAAEAALDSVYVSGRFILDGVGKTAEGGIAPFTCELPFSCELPAEGVRRGDTAFLRVGQVGVSESRSESGVTLSVSAEIGGEVYGETSAQIVTDAFSPQCELAVRSEEVHGMLVRGAYRINDRAEGTVALPEGDNADKITAAVGFGLTALSVYPDGGKLVIEGAAAGYVIYADAEAGRRASCCAELPFRMTTDISAEDGDEAIADGCVCSVSARPSRRGEISISCALGFGVLHESPVYAAPVTAMEKGDAKDERTGVLSMHSAAAGETLWACARSLSVAPDAVLAQNPGLEFPLSRGEKVFVFRSGSAGRREGE